MTNFRVSLEPPNVGVSNIIECQQINFKLLETPTAHKIEVDLSCYVKIMVV